MKQIALSPESKHRLKDLLRTGDGLGAETVSPFTTQAHVTIIKCTVAPDESGKAKGKVAFYADDTWTTPYHEVWLIEANGVSLSVGNRYPAIAIGGGDDGVGIYVTGSGNGILRGKLDGTLSAGATATMSIWDSHTGSSADTGLNITVYDWLLTSGNVASGKKVIAYYEAVSNHWYVLAAECA